ncbi:MAG: hypothetical protein ACR2PU_00385 [Gammaproteobacteria bacterium]
MSKDKYGHITRLIKQIGQLIVDLELDELHTHQKIEQLNALVEELENIRDHYQREQSRLFWQEPTKEEANISNIDSDAA